VHRPALSQACPAGREPVRELLPVSAQSPPPSPSVPAETVLPGRPSGCMRSGPPARRTWPGPGRRRRPRRMRRAAQRPLRPPAPIACRRRPAATRRSLPTRSRSPRGRRGAAWERALGCAQRCRRARCGARAPSALIAAFVPWGGRRARGLELGRRRPRVWRWAGCRRCCPRGACRSCPRCCSSLHQ